MSLWRARPGRRRAAAPQARTEREQGQRAGQGPAQGTGPAAGPRVLVEDHDGLLLLRLPTDNSLLPADVADLARVLAAADGGRTVTILAAVEGAAAAALWPRLSESLDSLRDTGTRSVRLVMSGAGLDRADRPALARRIADAWDLTVEAPDGPVLVVPGGSVFVPPGDGGWWRFAAGREPELLGPRAPAPGWQAAVRRAPVRTADGCVVDQIPAGLLIRPAEAAAPRPGDLFHAVPVDPRRPAVVVGVPWGEDIVATDVAELLGALPAAVRPGVRLAPGGRRDLLPLGRSVAALLGAEVEVTTGIPLFAADGPMGRYGIRSVLAGPDGDPRWLPFVDAVLCLPPPETALRPDPAPGPGPAPDPDADPAPVPPPAPAPRLLRWTSPVPELGGTRDGVLRLSDEWQAVITRAGLWVGSRASTPPPPTARPVSIDGPVVEIGQVGDRIDASLFPVLSRFLHRLTPDLRTRITLDVRGTAPDGGRALRGLAAEHALRVIRFASPSARPASRGTPSSPAIGTARTPAAARPVPDARGTAATAAPGGPDTPAGPPVLVTEGGTGTGTGAGTDSDTGTSTASGTGTSTASGAAPRTVSGPAAGETGAGPAALGRPATVSAADRSGEEPERTLSSPVSAPDPAPPVPPVAEAVTAELTAGPPPAPEAPRPTRVETGAPAAPVAPARRAPTTDGAAPTPAPTPPPPAPESESPRPEPPRTQEPRTPDAGRPFAAVSVLPRHRSTAQERKTFRTLADPVWERHSAAVNRALSGMPALRGHEQEATRIDLIALRIYLSDTEGALNHAELRRSLRAGEQRLASYGGCLTSGLGRLPSYRGVVLRGRSDAAGHEDLRPGDVLRDPAPLSGRPLSTDVKERVTGVGYAIWSITGRRVRQLLDGGDEVVFAPGTAFKVLGVRSDTAAGPLVLLRQLPDAQPASTVLEDADETALGRLDHALTDRLSPGSGDWPDRCAGPFGGPGDH